MTEEQKEQEQEVPVEPEVKQELRNNVDMVSEITTELKRFFTFDILNYIHKPWKLIGLNFFMGLVRGIGFFLGMTIVGAIVFTMLTKGLQAGIEAKIPILSEWLAQLVAMVQNNMQMVK
ncbi:hypothetical protein KKF70_01040 [bacterium]|nr:hypothetical protein [Candidatus Omnitrophota bacterium]MBU2527958.1 hypothetical protein [bacterium]MBU3930147.1 hypothetical protein [bacterium]MBU4122723.1 hypothetical protein [bacterium]